MCLGPLDILLGEVSVQGLCSFFNRIVCLPGVELCEFLYICIKPLSEVSLANILSHTVGCLFILLLFYLAVQKLFSLVQSHLFIFSFISLAIGDIAAWILLCRISEIFLPMFLSRNSMMSWLICNSFIHFKFILIYGVSWWSSFPFLHVPVQFSQCHLLKRLSSIHCMFLPPLSNINWP